MPPGCVRIVQELQIRNCTRKRFDISTNVLGKIEKKIYGSHTKCIFDAFSN